MTEKEGWKSEETIRHYQRTADITIPGRRDILLKIADLATAFISHQPRILDLGCGSGDVAAEIIRIKPDTLIYMVDFSDGMIQLVRDRFQNNMNIEIITHDLNKGIPNSLLSKKFDAVTSCFALHHIEYENRTELYTQIRQVLSDDGLFINGDIFIGESPSISKWELNNLITWIVDQAKNKLGIDRTFEQVKQRHLELAEKQGDKPGTLRDMQEGLRQAGFQYVDCVWMQNRHAIVTGIGTVEKADCKIIEIAALLHDIGTLPLAWARHASGKDDYDFQEFLGSYALLSANHGEVGSLIAEQFLKQTGYPEIKTKQVAMIIREHNSRNQTTLESRVVSDADRLEALGATWVARAFQRTNAFDRRISIESIPQKYLEGRKSFLDDIYTESVKEMARKRYRFMTDFIEQFQMEMNLDA